MAKAADIRPPSEVFADPVTALYSGTVDRLLVNIASRFRIDDDEFGSTRWQFRMLAETGQLNKSNSDIIADMMKDRRAIVRDSIERAAISALDQTEPTFAAAVKAGYLSDPGTPILSPRVRDVVNAYTAQAESTLNLVNTRMLDSGLVIYRKAISSAMAFVQGSLTPTVTAGILNILNQNTLDVALGVLTRQEALRAAVKSLADSGIYGFVDRAGRKWSPEAYVNMDMRTTCGNTAMQATFTRNEEYGNDLIWWPILASARPGCYPWQGKICSTSNRSGTVTDLRGGVHVITPINQTTYGQPDGIGGINCHHKPANIFIPGMSMIRGSLPSKAENDERYAETQQSRKLERNVRDAKRRAAMADATGDKESFEKAAQQVKKRDAELKNFFKKTGQPFYSDRTQVYGYDRSVSQRATNAAKRAKNAAATKAAARNAAPASTAPVAIRSRAQLIGRARTVYIERNAALGADEARRRFDLLVDGNTDAQMRDYINRYGKRKVTIPKGGFK